jgi:hypothetical protein
MRRSSLFAAAVTATLAVNAAAYQYGDQSGRATVTSTTTASSTPPMPLPCKAVGKSAKYARDHTIDNNTRAAIPAGFVLSWSASDGGAGTHRLTAPLAPGAGVRIEAPGQTPGYSCTATFMPPAADLQVLRVKPDRDPVVELRNRAAWRPASATSLRLRSFRCPAKLLGSHEQPLGALRPEESTAVTLSRTLVTHGADYIEVTVNPDRRTSEADYSNNTARLPLADARNRCVEH